MLKSKSKLRENDLIKRIAHFQSVYDVLESTGNQYHLEKDWFDDVIQLSREDIINEIKLSINNLDTLYLKRKKRIECLAFWLSMLISIIVSVVTSVTIIYLLSSK